MRARRHVQLAVCFLLVAVGRAADIPAARARSWEGEGQPALPYGSQVRLRSRASAPR